MIDSPYDLLARLKDIILADPDFEAFKSVEVSSGIELGAFPSLSIYGDDEVVFAPFDDDADYATRTITATIAHRADDPRALVPVLWEYGDRLRRFLIANIYLADADGVGLLETSAVTTMFIDPDLGQVDWIQAITLHWDVEFFLSRRRSDYSTPAPITSFRLEVDDIDTALEPDEFVEGP